MHINKVMIPLLLISGCSSNAENVDETQQQGWTCTFTAGVLNSCHLDSRTFSLKGNKNEYGEIVIRQLSIETGSEVTDLAVSEDTSFLPDDLIVLHFADINFDQERDIALSTIAGTPNVYFDYWVYQEENRAYHFVGNYPALTLDAESQRIFSTVKSSAAAYDTIEYEWSGVTLVEKRN